MSRLVRLYPTIWRERYEAEFLELVASCRPSMTDQIDIVRSALDAHLHPQVSRPDKVGPPPLAESNGRLARRLGFGTLTGAALWVVAWIVVLLGPVRYDDDGAYRDGAAAFPFLFGAVALIGGGLAGQFVVLPKDALLARVGAGLALLFTVVWGIQPWLLWAGIPMIGGLAILALAGYRARAWPGWSSASVCLACIVVVVLMGYGITTAIDRMAGGVLLTIAGTAFVPAWLGLGATLLSPKPA